MVDQKTGYTTRNMLCNPIFDISGQVMGVAQVINKKGTPTFTVKDENVFSQYLQFCGIGLRNAQLYERSQLENKRNQVLLDLARMVFEKQSNIENIIYRILLHIQSLLQCSRYDFTHKQWIKTIYDLINKLLVLCKPLILLIDVKSYYWPTVQKTVISI